MIGTRVKPLGVTRVLALAGVTDFAFCDSESLWRGSEVHRICELADRGTLDEKTIPKDMQGYRSAHRKFMRETGFICTHIEFEVKSKHLGVRGRGDRAGLMRGKRTILDFKTGSVNPATALQLVLYGHLLDGEWWERIAVELRSDGSYKMTTFPLLTWAADLQTALSCVRVATWKLKHGLV
jgi:hypothetical protein